MKANVRHAGFLTTVQDAGREGFRALGVSLGGALDSFALWVANSLVGNDPAAAGLEVTLGGLELAFTDDRIVAWCGGDFDVRMGPVKLPPGHAALIHSGEELKFGPAGNGCRSWLALSGGVDVPLVLGSRSSDLRARFGGFDGRALRDGDEISLGDNSREASALIDKLRSKRISEWRPAHDWSSPESAAPVLRFVQGADWNRFDDSTIQRFSNESYAVSSESDRMGVRLRGRPLKPKEDGDLVSEAVAPGTIQVPPSGQPILLLGDCQTIGGYPKIANVITIDFPIAAQLRVGDHVRFRESSLGDAQRLLLDRTHRFEEFRRGLSLISDEISRRS